MNKKALVDLFRKTALLLEIKDIPFRPKEYENAANTIEEEDIESAIKNNTLEKLPSIGKNMAKRIKEFLKKGTFKEYKELRKEIPIDLESFDKVMGLGPKKLSKLYKELDVKNINDLEQAARAGKIKELDGFGEKTEEQFLEFLNNKGLKHSYKKAKKVSDSIIKQILPFVEKIEPCGSLRRKENNIGDVDFLVISNQPKKTIDEFIKVKECKKIISQGIEKASILTKKGIQVNLRIWNEYSFGSGLLYFTGNREHNIKLKKLASSKNMKLTEFGLIKNKLKISRDEKNIYNTLGLNFIPPEERQGKDELETYKI